jgi:hypothetical protein
MLAAPLAKENAADLRRWALCGAVIVFAHGAIAAGMVTWRKAAMTDISSAAKHLSFPKILSTRIRAMRRIRASCDAMLAILHLFGTSVANLFKSRRRLEVENLFLRH